MLFLTGTHISVPALTGAIMCMGVATANSILVVSFAKEQMEEGLSAAEAALTAGFTRFRPVIMTALAMIIGMVPMALGLGDGGEQNAPLGRAVIGGLLLATFGTLTFVPAFFSFMHRNDPPHASGRSDRANADRDMKSGRIAASRSIAPMGAQETRVMSAESRTVETNRDGAGQHGGIWRRRISRRRSLARIVAADAGCRAAGGGRDRGCRRSASASMRARSW